MMIYSLEEAKKLGNQFAEELQKDCNEELDWWFFGSIKNGGYVAGKSDIDMIIIPKDKGFINPKGKTTKNMAQSSRKAETFH